MLWIRRKHQPQPIGPPADDIYHRLAVLGSTPSEVAKTLVGLDIVGERSHIGCPVSHYLRRQYNTTEVQVRTKSVTVKETEIAIPGIIAEFIYLFDKNYFPELDMHKRKAMRKEVITHEKEGHKQGEEGSQKAGQAPGAA